MLKLSCKFGELQWNPCWLIVLTNSTGTNYGLNEQEDFDQYGSFTIPSKIMSYQSHPASLVDLLDKLIELLTRVMGTDRQTDGQTDRRRDGQTQVMTITLWPKRPRVKNQWNVNKNIKIFIKKIHSKMLFAKWQPFYLILNVWIAHLVAMQKGRVVLQHCLLTF